jgi:hypothetical protein
VHNRALSLFSDGTVVELLEDEEDEEDDATLNTRSKRSSSLSSPGAQLSITPSLARGGDDVFSAAMPPPKPSAQLGVFSLKKKSTK